MVDVANDTTTTAVLDPLLLNGVIAGGSYSGLIETAGDIDFIRVTLTAGVTYRFYGSAQTTGTNPPSRLDSVMRLIGSDGTTELAHNDDDGAGNNSYFEYTATVTDTYYIEMKSFDTVPANQVGAYSVFVTGLSPFTNEELNSAPETYTTAVANAFVMAGAGDDIVNLGTTSGSIGIGAVGEQGNDTLNGNALANQLAGGLGDDTLFGFGGADALWGDAGDDELNGGAGADQMRGGDGNDTITDTDVMLASTDDIYDGGDGVDTLVHDFNWVSSTHFNLATGFATLSGVNRDQLIGIENLTVGGNAQVTGDSNANVLTVNGSGNNIIAGCGGGDTITGGGGADTLTGDDGNDVFLIAAPGDFASGETIDGGADSDTIRFTSTTGGQTLTLGADVTDVEIVEIADATGNLAGTADLNLDVSFVNNGLTIRGNDGANAILGTLLGDTINGGRGIDTINGDGGGDTIDGGAGTDSVFGGAGDDLLVIGLAEGNDNLDGGGDVDTADLSALTPFNLKADLLAGTWGDLASAFGILADIENVTTSVGNDTLTGNGEANVLSGGGGNDTLRGGGGADTIIAGGGDDTVFFDGGEGNLDSHDGGADTDTINGNGTAFAADATFNLAAGTYSVQSNPSEVWANFENYTNTGGGRETVIGTSGVNVIATGSGSNLLIGNGGADQLNGGGGIDNMSGGDGSDTYFADVFNDIVFEANSSLALGGDDLVNYSGTGTFTLGANIERLTLLHLTAAVNGTGNTRANTITGNAGNNILNGMAGLDTLIGGNGNDTYVVNRTIDGATTDVVQETGTVASTADLVQFTGNAANQLYTLGTGVERLTLLGTLATNGTGNTLGNVITGNAGNNILNGMSGLDTLNGGNGNDTYVINRAIDGATTDAVQETGTVASTADLVQFTGNAAGQIYTLGANLENLTLLGAFGTNGTGNTLANIITGNGATNTIRGGAGNDTLAGGAGKDSLFGENNDDTFRFLAVGDSPVGANRDVIFDLDDFGNDVIDLSLMAGVSTFIGIAAFTAAGQVRAIQAGANVLVQINTVGAGGAESEILIAGATLGAGIGQVDAGDFLL